MDNETIKKLLREHIKTELGFDSSFGKISISSSDSLGEGGNGLVYRGRLNEQESLLNDPQADRMCFPLPRRSYALLPGRCQLL